MYLEAPKDRFKEDSNVKYLFMTVILNVIKSLIEVIYIYIYIMLFFFL